MNQESRRKDVGARPERLSVWLLVYALCYALFHISPPYLKWKVWNYLWTGDLVDVLTPFVIVFLAFRIYRMLFRKAERLSSLTRFTAIVLFIFGAVAFVEGHGMHLSANAIARHLSDARDTPVYSLTYFFDEVLGHILWDSGIVVLSLGLIVMGLHIGHGIADRPRVLLMGIASLVYGFTYFVNAVEGQTVVFMFPLAIAIPVTILCAARRQGVRLFRNPVLFFFFFNHVFAVCLFLVWGVWHGGFPQFSELGWV